MELYGQYGVTRVKSGNFGYQVNLDSNRVCIIFQFLE